MSKSLVKVRSNLSIVMCHAFIIDQTFMPPPIASPKFSNEKGRNGYKMKKSNHWK
jgi:hypothetical protein